MLEISQQDIQKRLTFDNPWWDDESTVDASYRNLPKRSYFAPFYNLITNRKVNRAVILMGPRRVGKTVMLHQSIEQLLADGTPGDRILFLSLETPVYTDTALEKFVRNFQERFGHPKAAALTIIFDEIQYLKDWEVHLKSLVDSFPHIRFVASGSAAAALRLKSRESGAGRFTEFLLPPLTFAEYLDFVGKEEKLIGFEDENTFHATDIEALNTEFVNYLNYGGYPEAVFNATVRNESGRFIKSDIIDKVLLRDLPQLYGIRDIQELNRLFTTLAYNTGNEVSLDELSKSSGVAKATLSRYLEYLEAAFLIRRVHRIDQNARRFQRATSFKVYLTNPSMRAALFGNPAEDDQTMGALAETALFAQWFHDPKIMDRIYYARWDSGEIDLVHLSGRTQKPLLATEVKWSDRPAKDKRALRHLKVFRDKHPSLKDCQVTTRTVSAEVKLSETLTVRMRPTSIVIYEVGKLLLELKAFPALELMEDG
ncbi:MAG: ATP-binding protein [Verrucomicrobia bacterium]|nr:ATP-binding protein [Verrucomicrobiota bacterium]MCH8511482.1 ATP-binding protein [Kiritimatiellia bacterium]